MNGRPSASPGDADGSPVDQDQKPEAFDDVARSANGLQHLEAPRALSAARSRRPAHANGKAAQGRNGLVVGQASESAKQQSLNRDVKSSPSPRPSSDKPGSRRGPWFTTISVALIALLGLSLLGTVLHSLSTRQLDAKGCRMSYMRPSYIKYSEFDTEHTRFASKYSLYLYREQGKDNEKVLAPPLTLPSTILALLLASYLHGVYDISPAPLTTSN